MAFTGSATFKVVSEKCVRITGLSLAAGASGTIGLWDKTVAPDVRLPKSFRPNAYDNAEHHKVDITDQVDVKLNRGASTANANPIAIVKAGGSGTHTTGKDFSITITNGDGTNATPTLEIFVLCYGS